VTISLNQKAIAALLIFVAAIMALLFVFAGTFHWWQGWTFLVFYLVPSIAITAYLMVNDPALLARRMRGGPTAENSATQKIIMSIVSVGFIGLLVVPALDHSFGWSHMPLAVTLAGDAMILIGWIAVFVVFRENSFTSSTIEIFRRPEGDLDRALRAGATSDVCGRVHHVARHSTGARIMVGASCACGDDARADLAHLR